MPRVDAQRRTIRVLTVVGTRPEVIKMAPVMAALEANRTFESVVCAIGQHREMLGQALDVFALLPQYERCVMRPRQSLARLTAVLTREIDDVVEDCRPDWILAQGDTTTVMTTALVAFYRGVRFGHVEAGLRTGDLQEPFPEEVNRRVADLIASVHFAPTPQARAALVAEGCDPDRIHVTGNTIVDALRMVADRPYDWRSGPLAAVDPDRPIVLVTVHRRESVGAKVRHICLAIADLARRFAPESVQFVCPVHLNPAVRDEVLATLSGQANVMLLPPLDYASLVQVMRRAQLILTDSGGIQEEAPSFGVPVLVLRDKTERPEGLATGLMQLVGTDRERIVRAATRLIGGPAESGLRKWCPNPYGDGHTAGRILSILERLSAVTTADELVASSHG
jgi:UDP-N-acetylglucosamine 2-epimerase (non-hydrolysing)